MRIPRPGRPEHRLAFAVEVVAVRGRLEPKAMRDDRQFAQFSGDRLRTMVIAGRLQIFARPPLQNAPRGSRTDTPEAMPDQAPDEFPPQRCRTDDGLHADFIETDITSAGD